MSSLGYHHTDEAKAKMSAWQKGIPKSEEFKQKRKLRVGILAPAYGITYSEEVKYKMREKQRGRVFTDEHRQKLSKARTGKKICFSDEWKRKQKERKGDKCPSWKGGISFEPYCVKFNKEFKERVRAYFSHTCIECGTPQNGTKLCVHHVNFNKMSCCDTTVPLFVPLCKSCHNKTNFNRDFWESYFTQIIEGYYEGKCYFTKEEFV